MEITETLKSDHEELKGLLSKMTHGNSATDTKQSALKDFKALLKAHSEAEEKIVYDALIKESDEEAEKMACEGYTEHEVADYVLGKLTGEGKILEKLTSNGDPDSPQWKAQAKVLKELVEHHIEEEEDEIFAKLRSEFDKSKREEMGQRFEELRDKKK